MNHQSDLLVVPDFLSVCVCVFLGPPKSSVFVIEALSITKQESCDDYNLQLHLPGYSEKQS